MRGRDQWMTLHWIALDLTVSVHYVTNNKQTKKDKITVNQGEPRLACLDDDAINRTISFTLCT